MLSSCIFAFLLLLHSYTIFNTRPLIFPLPLLLLLHFLHFHPSLFSPLSLLSSSSFSSSFSLSPSLSIPPTPTSPPLPSPSPPPPPPLPGVLIMLKYPYPQGVEEPSIYDDIRVHAEWGQPQSKSHTHQAKVNFSVIIIIIIIRFNQNYIDIN